MRKKLLLTSTAILFMLQPLTAFAVTEDEVLAVGKETATGNVFIWFLCAIAFLKISQKIDSFMASLGINVGQTGGSMLSELLVAAKAAKLEISQLTTQQKDSALLAMAQRPPAPAP